MVSFAGDFTMSGSAHDRKEVLMSSNLQRSLDSDSTSRGNDPSSPVGIDPNDDWPKPSGFDLDGDGAPDSTKDDAAAESPEEES